MICLIFDCGPRVRSLSGIACKEKEQALNVGMANIEFVSEGTENRNFGE